MAQSSSLVDVRSEQAFRPDDRRRAAALVGALAALIALAVLVGSQTAGATSVDMNLSDWFVAQRTPFLDNVTAFFSEVANTSAIVGVAIVVVAGCLVRRAYRAASLIVVAMVGEIVMFLTITFAVERPRPDVVRLDSAPPTSSFPSGHTLAAFVLWTAIAVVAVRQVAPLAVRCASRVLALIMPLTVGLSRVYRGMHHPTDVVASFVLGALWMAAVVILFSRPIRWISVMRPRSSVGRSTQ